jgi:hypothetical protein
MPAGSVFSLLGQAAPFIMVGLAAAIFGGLVLANRHLRALQPVETPPPALTLPPQPPVELPPPGPPLED